MSSYRIFVGAFPEGELAEQIQQIRLQYDAVTARIAPPHVTLAGAYTHESQAPGTALTAENEAESIRRLEILPGILQPFNLILGGVHTFPGKRPVVYLDVQVNQGLVEARNLLLSVLGMDKHSEFKPHLTLAMRLSWDKAWEMVNELQVTAWNKPPHTFLISELRLMQREPADPAWRCIHKITL